MIEFAKPYNKPIKEADYDEFIEQFKLDLPHLYKQIMVASNGGFPVKSCFDGDTIYFTPIKYEDFNMYALLEVSGIDYLKMGLYPFCDGAGGISYCIGLDKEKYRKVYCIDETSEYWLVADSLEDFIGQLEEEPDDQSMPLDSSDLLKEKKPFLKKIFSKLFRF